MMAFLAGPLIRFAAPALIGALLGGWLMTDLTAGRYQGKLAAAENNLADSRLRHAADLKAVSDAATAAAREHALRSEEMQRQIAEADAHHTGALRDAQVQNDRLRADLRSGARRLRVTAVCRPSGRRGVPSAAAATRLDDGASGSAELHGGTAADLAALAGRADAVAARLAALQDYARAVSARRP